MHQDPTYEPPAITRHTTVDPELIGFVGSEVVCAVFGGDGGKGGDG